MLFDKDRIDNAKIGLDLLNDNTILALEDVFQLNDVTNEENGLSSIDNLPFF